MKSMFLGTILCLLTIFLAPPVSYPLELGVDLDLAYHSWREHTSLGNLKESGGIWTVGGFIGGNFFGRIPALRLQGDAELFFGRVDYDTKTTTGIPSNTESAYLGVKAEGSAGWLFDYGRTHLEPFLGIAYRGWERNIESTGVAQGYPEYYNIIYSKVGIRADHRLSPEMVLHGALSLDPMLWAEEEIDWTSVSGETLVVRNGKRLGWTIEGGARWKHWKATGYWHAIRLGKSSEVSCLSGTSICFQPKSDLDTVGMTIGYLF
jgi:hypothetical protein